MARLAKLVRRWLSFGPKRLLRPLSGWRDDRRTVPATQQLAAPSRRPDRTETLGFASFIVSRTNR